MSHDMMLTLSFYFWIFVFGVILSIPSKSKTFVSIKPKFAPNPEVFDNNEKSP